MLAYDLNHWVAFFSAALLLNLSPGPDIAFILQKTSEGGRESGFLAIIGIWGGASVHVFLAVAGLTSILAASPHLYLIISLAGAIYLIWMGIAAVRGGETVSTSNGMPQNSAPWQIIRQGFLVASLNPKVAVFFMAFLPQFVEEGAGPVPLQLAVHGLLLIGTAGLVEPPLVLLVSNLRRGLTAKPKFSELLNRALGGMLIALGVRLLWSTLP